MNAIQLIREFAHQKPCLSFYDYGDVRIYRREAAEITADLRDFNELLSLAISRIDNLNEVLIRELSNSSGRLFLENEKLIYHTGQYWPTEFRPAANRVLAQIIFASYRDELVNGSQSKVYQNGIEIRKAIKRRVSRRVARNYFN